MTTLILKGIVQQLLTNFASASGTGTMYALPYSIVDGTTQLDITGTPDNVEVNFEISIDGLEFGSLQPIVVGLNQLDSIVAARFVRANVIANPDTATLNLTFLAKAFL